MGMKQLVVCLFVSCCILQGMCRLVSASAEVLPKGVTRVHVDTRFYLPITDQFDHHGHVEDIAADYNTSLNSNVFTGLQDLETFFGLPPGFASLGDTVVSFKYELSILRFSLQYGLTKNITVGLLVPYWWMKNRVKAKLDTKNATVGKSRALDALVPLGTTPDTVPLTKEDIQQILGDGLDVAGDGTIEAGGFGFKRFETWSGQGFGDIELGFRYQYLQTEDWQLAFTGGVRFPTGRTDDPDNLADYPFGSGAWALLFRLNSDFQGIKNLVLSGTFRYDLIFPDKQTLRVPDDVDQPVTANKTEVDRDLGDVFAFEVSGLYTLVKGLSLYALYEYSFALKTEADGEGDFAYDSLEDETDWTSHIVKTGVTYSTLPLFLQKKFPFPLSVGVFYRTRFAGTNNVLKSQYISVELTFLF